MSITDIVKKTFVPLATGITYIVISSFTPAYAQPSIHHDINGKGNQTMGSGNMASDTNNLPAGPKYLRPGNGSFTTDPKTGKVTHIGIKKEEVETSKSKYESLKRQAYAYEEKGDYENAINTMKKALEIKGLNKDTYAKTLWGIGSWYALIGNKTEAKKYLDKVINDYSNTFWAENAERTKKVRDIK